MRAGASAASAAACCPWQAHYGRVVAPALAGSVSELSAASAALLALLRAVEDSITLVLQKSVDAFMAQVRASAAAH